MLKGLVDLLVTKLKEILQNSVETNTLLSNVNNKVNTMVRNVPSTAVRLVHSTDLALSLMNTVGKTLPAHYPSNVPKIAVEQHYPISSISNVTTPLSWSPTSVHPINVNKDVTRCNTRSSNKSTKDKITSKQTIPNLHKIAKTASNTEHIIAVGL